MLPLKTPRRKRARSIPCCAGQSAAPRGKGRRRHRVAIRTGDDRNEVIARRNIADFKRRGDGRQFIDLGRRGHKIEQPDRTTETQDRITREARRCNGKFQSSGNVPILGAEITFRKSFHIPTPGQRRNASASYTPKQYAWKCRAHTPAGAHFSSRVSGIITPDMAVLGFRRPRPRKSQKSQKLPSRAATPVHPWFPGETPTSVTHFVKDVVADPVRPFQPPRPIGMHIKRMIMRRVADIGDIDFFRWSRRRQYVRRAARRQNQ